MNSLDGAKNKYINESYQGKGAQKLATVFLFALFVMPQYVGVQVAGFDLTILRMAMLIFLVYILAERSRVKNFCTIIGKAPYSILMLPYLMVLFYTTVLRVNINTILQTAIEFLCMFISCYIIIEIQGLHKFIKQILGFSYFLTALGIIEFVMKRSPFSYFETIPGVYSGAFIRSGAYRVMGPCNHSLAYGLLLITVFPLVCLNLEKNTIEIMKRPLLFLLVSVNIFLTGSRSTLAVFFLELFLIFLFSSNINKKKFFMIMLVIITALALFVIVFYNTSPANYIMRQVCSIIDSMFHTQYAAKYGAEVKRLADSARTRELTLKIFTLDWLNPLLGRGLKRGVTVVIEGCAIISVDNFYVCQYIRFAYPGLITYVILVLYILINMLKQAITKKSGLMAVLFIASTSYFINLWFLDSLQTLKYVYIQFAIFTAATIQKTNLENKEQVKQKGRYLR